ncbi:MAG: S-layer homology domain-containing protein [Chloroflexota bacterium]|nr:S-layer homology domain-containing protein [Chloroflexota bacterium]MDQ5866438.1 S-layer homology domain-containing protein [Chloroflexota bacterium]
MQFTDFGATDRVDDIAIQADGKIVAVGQRWVFNSHSKFAVARYNIDGSLDTTFSGDGMDTIDFSDEDLNAYARGVAIQNDGKIVVAGMASLPLKNGYVNVVLALVRYNTDGSLDTTFSGDGIVTGDFRAIGVKQVQGEATVIQADGKILVAGKGYFDGSSWDFILARYNTDGSLDTTFSGGLVSSDLGGQDYGQDVALQADGKIVMSGAHEIKPNVWDFGLVRYNTNGSIDTSFSGDGMVITDLGGDNWAYGVTVQPDGKIVAVGGGTLNGRDGFAIARYNSDGSMDSSFSQDGLLVSDFGEHTGAQDVAIQADGKLVVVGSIAPNYKTYWFALARYNPDGSPDSSFSDDGFVDTYWRYRARGSSVAIQADGKIVVAGESLSLGNLDFAVARYLASGGDTSCTIQFADVPEGSPFYDFVRCLACRGVLSGYPNGLFGVNDPIKRGQLSKIVANAAGFTEDIPATQRTFEDVLPGSTFHEVIERLAQRGVISGYACGGVNPELFNEEGKPLPEPCGPENLKYFRPNNLVKRGQTAKIVASAAELPAPPAGSWTFQDAAPESAFYVWIERMVLDGIISGYNCGGVNPDTAGPEPCQEGNKPYFRPNSLVKRGQAAKIVANTFFPDCQTPARK